MNKATTHDTTLVMTALMSLRMVGTTHFKAYRL
nr:MAG TPA: hypothetical protein [Crassvirales sp.]